MSFRRDVSLCKTLNFNQFGCKVTTFFSSEEHVGNENGCEHATEVSQKTCLHGVTCVFDTHASEVNGKDVEGGVGGTLEDTTQSASKAIRTVGSHCIDHHTTCTASAEWFHERCWQCIDEVGVAAHEFEETVDALNEQVHTT